MPYQTIGDCSLFYEDIGLGDPVLFLHSGYSRGIVAFGAQIQPFFQAYRCLLPDFRGHGRSRCADKTWDTPRIAEDMAQFLGALGIQRAHLVGYSLGAGVALHLAASSPQMARSIITIGCGGVADPSGADDFEPEALLHGGQHDLIARMTAMHADAHGGDWQTFMRQSARDWRMYPCLEQAAWQRLTMPMLLIGGEHDPFASPDKLAAMQARCPQATIWTVPGGSHRPHMTLAQGKEVTERMLAFIKTA